MKARRKGTDSPFVEIQYVQLTDSDILYKAEIMEFESEPNFDYLSTEIKTKQQLAEIDYWEKLKHQAAIAAMQGILSSWTIDYGDSSAEYITKTAVELADTLVENLKK